MKRGITVPSVVPESYIKKEIVIPEHYHEVKEALAFARGWMRGRG